MVELAQDLLLGQRPVLPSALKQQYERHQALTTLLHTPANGTHRNESSGERASGPQRPSPDESSRRHVPERPPDFSHSAICSIVIVRSLDLHMS